MNCDASKIWENYKISKTALAQFQTTEEKPSGDSGQHLKLNDSTNADQVFSSTFYDDVDIEEVLKDLNEIRQLKSPRFDKSKAFPKDKLLPLKSLRNQIDPLKIRNAPLFVAHATIEHQEKPVEIASKPGNFPTPESLKTRVVRTVAELKTGQIRPAQNGHVKSTAEIKLAADKIVLDALINGTKVELKENGSNSPKTPKTPDKDVTLGGFSEAKAQKIELVNGQKTDEMQNVPKNEKLAEDKKDLVTNDKIELESLISPSKVNELNKTIEAKFHDIPKLPVAIANGFSYAPKAITNGIATKLAPFVSRISDSESGDAESDEISIGQQRLLKSPDFWI